MDYLLKDGKSNTSKWWMLRLLKRKEQSFLMKLSRYWHRRNRAENTCTCTVENGRHHQIRVQMANAGMSLLGDTKYGSEDVKEYSRLRRIKNVALCAYHLEFVHPVNGKKMEFNIEPKGEAFRPFFQLIPENLWK